MSVARTEKSDAKMPGCDRRNSPTFAIATHEFRAKQMTLVANHIDLREVPGHTNHGLLHEAHQKMPSERNARRNASLCGNRVARVQNRMDDASHPGGRAESQNRW